jgi:hypothetical protein
MPQNGGNASLTGGNLWIFNPRSSPDVIKAAFDFVTYSNFNLDVLESSNAQKAANGQAVGAPTAQMFKGSFQQQLSALDTKYSTVPRDNYKTYINSTFGLRRSMDPCRRSSRVEALTRRRYWTRPQSSSSRYSTLRHRRRTLVSHSLLLRPLESRE